MILLAIVSFLAFFLYLQLGMFVLFHNPSSKSNRSFFYLCCCLMIWSFGMVFMYFSPHEDSVIFWERFSSFGWIFFPAFMVTFFVDLKKTHKNIIDNLVKLIFFLAAGLFFLQSLLDNLLTKGYYMLNETWHFQIDLESVWFWLYLIYLACTLAYCLISLFAWSLKANTIKERKQAHIILITLIMFFTGIFISNYVFPLLGDVKTPGLIHVISFIWVTGFGHAIVKYKFMVLSPEIAASAIISKMNELLFFVDNNGFVTRVNDFTESVLGFKHDEVINKPFENLLVDKEQALGRIAKLDQKQRSKLKNQEYYLRQKAGDYIPFNLSSAEVKDEAGDILGTIIVGYDVRYQKLLEEEIELRKQTELALQESEKKTKKLYSMVRLMCDNVPDMIWAKDLNNKYIFVNKATSNKLLNAKDQEEPIGRSEQYFYDREKNSHPNNKKWFTFGDISTDSDSITIRNREPGRYIEFGTIKNKFLYLDVHKAPFWDEFGSLIGTVGCGRDITTEKSIEEEHRLALKALEREKEFLSVTLKSIADGVITTDKSERIVSMNNVAEQLTGWKRSEVWGKPLSSVLNIVDPKSKKIINLPVMQTMQQDEIIKIHSENDPEGFTKLIDKDKNEITITASVTPIKTNVSSNQLTNAITHKDNEEIIGTVVVFSDMTDRIRIENELIKVQKMELVSVLAGGIAHDFNNILTSIIGNLSILMLKIKDNSEWLKNLQDAEKACFRARDLTQQLLSFSKGVNPIKRVIVLDKVIKESAIFSVRGSNCDCHFNIEPNLYPVEADESQISQVINNLVINAIQSMPEGGPIKIKTENCMISKESTLPLPEGRYIRISVKDNGVGIPEHHLQKIFDPFFTTKHQGSGLGLTGSFNIIKKHNGFLTVESQEGIGSIFHIYLPASKERPMTIEQEEIIHDFQDSGHVLILDDDEEVLNTLAELLVKIGYTVTKTNSGEQTISEFKVSSKFDSKYKFVILDLTIRGGMGGKDTIKNLLEIDPEVKAIVSSGYSSDDVISNYKDYGFKEVMEKPYSYKNLVHTIIRLFED